jgi:hypothetical protein
MSRFLFSKIIYFFIFLSACTPHFYQPKPLEPVLLTRADQLKINIVSDKNMSAISAAYSPSTNLGLTAGIATNSNKTTGTDNNGQEKIFLDEHYANPYVGIGYFKHFSENFLFETYAGAGTYTYKNNALSYLKNMKNVDLYLQPSIAFINDYIDVAFTVRIDYLNRGATIIKDSVLTQDDQKRYSFLNYKSYLFAQPGITIRAGFKYVKFQFQISQSIAFNNNYKSIYGYGSRALLDPYEDRNHIVIGVGISGEINNVFKKKK